MRLTITIFCIFAGLTATIGCGGTAEVEQPTSSTPASPAATSESKATDTAAPIPTSTPRPTAVLIPTPESSVFREIIEEVRLHHDEALQLAEEDSKTLALIRAERIDGSKRCETIGALYNHDSEFLDYLHRRVADNIDSFNAEELERLLDIQTEISEIIDSLNEDFGPLLEHCGIAVR